MDERKISEFSNIESFRKSEVKEARENIKKEINKSKNIIDIIEVLEILLLLISLTTSSLSAILKQQPEVTILASIASFFNGLNIASKVKNSNEEKKLSSFKHKKKQLNIKISKALDDELLDHSDFESIIDMTDSSN